MLRATAIVRRQELAPRMLAGTILLDREGRYRRRVMLASDQGLAFLLDLPAATYLEDGDGLLLEDGRIIAVRAAAEALMEIRAANAVALARIAWHIGNRHTPAEIAADALYLKPDHVLAEMVQGLGGTVRSVERPFEPEGGAYGHKGALHEGHSHARG